jgi:hypothetical protein
MSEDSDDDAGIARGRCLCGKVQIEIGVPARWAWHDHSKASRIAHGAAYATYVGCWRSRLRIAKGRRHLACWEDERTRTRRSFCRECGTPISYERAHSPQMVNVPRALFESRTGREPRYHIGLAEAPDWAYRGAALAPLKGFPGVMWERPKRVKRSAFEEPPAWATEPSQTSRTVTGRGGPRRPRGAHSRSG